MSEDRKLNGPHLCGACGTVVQAEVHGAYVQAAEDWEDCRRITFAECTLCHAPMVLSLRPTGYREPFWTQPGEETGLEFHSEEYTCIFPTDGRALPFPLPEKVKRSYEQAILSERGGASIAVAVMVRRTLEALARDIVPAEGRRPPTLHTSLLTMKERGAISDEMHIWATKLRIIGNAGAHAGEEDVTDEDAKDALDFLQAMLETIYHFRPRFQALEARRSGPAAAGEGE